MKILAVGDIHCKTWIIDAVEAIATDYDKVVFCGDYADDWNGDPQDSFATWFKLNRLMRWHNNVSAVVGNHDYAYLHSDIANSSSGYSFGTQYLLNQAIDSGIKDWLKSLPVTIEVDGITFSHAGITEEWSGAYDVQSLWSTASPIWARPRSFGGQVTYKNIPQVIGHNPSKTCHEIAPGVWCIDTFSTYRDGSAYGDNTVLEIDNGNYKTIKLKETNNEHNNNTTSVQTSIS